MVVLCLLVPSALLAQLLLWMQDWKLQWTGASGARHTCNTQLPAVQWRGITGAPHPNFSETFLWWGFSFATLGSYFTNKSSRLVEKFQLFVVMRSCRLFQKVIGMHETFENSLPSFTDITRWVHENGRLSRCWGGVWQPLCEPLWSVEQSVLRQSKQSRSSLWPKNLMHENT